MTALIDTTVLVYRFDPRDSVKQRVARAATNDTCCKVA